MIPAPKRRTLAEAKELIADGYPAVAELLPQLVAWLSDQNSSGFSEMAEFLLSIERPVIPHIKKALRLDTVGEWHCALLYNQVRHWPREWVKEVEEELVDLAWNGTSNWGVDTQAIWLLAKNGLGNRQTLLSLVTEKKQGRYSELAELAKLEHYLASAETEMGPSMSGPQAA
jgi:hypothetical protein